MTPGRVIDRRVDALGLGADFFRNLARDIRETRSR